MWSRKRAEGLDGAENTSEEKDNRKGGFSLDTVETSKGLLLLEEWAILEERCYHASHFRRMHEKQA